jgi:hypothetical protein
MAGKGGFWPWAGWSKPMRIAVSSMTLLSVLALVAVQFYFSRGL